MRDTDHVLLDDWSVVEYFGDVMAGCADELDAALESLMIRARSNKRRQKRVVNVDNALRVAVDEFVRQNLHVAGEHHEVRLMLLDEGVNPGLSVSLILLRDRDDGIGDLVEVGDRLIVRVIRNDQRNIAS